VSRPIRIGIVDYGMGNRRSVEKAFEHIGVAPVVTSDHAALREVDGLVVPGVGAFRSGIENLRERELDGLLAERVDEGVPILGICLGMQLLFDSSSEQGGAQGLGVVAGEVCELDAPDLNLPHIGWNLVTWQRDSALTVGLGPAAAFYHVHTYAARPVDPADILGVGEYGAPFVSAIDRGPLFGVQFHPEKSSTHGLLLLKNFSAICARVAA